METNLLAADRVYLLLPSPADVVGFYPTRFTVARLHGLFRFCGTFPKVALGCR